MHNHFEVKLTTIYLAYFTGRTVDGYPLAVTYQTCSIGSPYYSSHSKLTSDNGCVAWAPKKI